jgi:hypothetical protein
VSYHKRLNAGSASPAYPRLEGNVVVDAFHHHGQQATEMGRDDLHVGISAGDARYDEVHDGDRVFDRRTHRPDHLTLVDQGRFRAATRRMHVQHALSTIEFRIDRMECAIGERASQHRSRDRGANHAQFVEGPAQFCKCGLGVRQGKSRQSAKAFRETPCHCGVFVVCQARSFHGIRPALEVR